ncbi:hypothetical protein DFJ74DRAFT_635227 [Hyaloraphidium curvatum]|nr:hypothetical protein DFJ74DRAFT_635227 [Hyaloraphidium curvatum]
MAPKPLQYEPFASAVDSTFWHALAALKLNVFKLDDAPVPIEARYGPGRLVAKQSFGDQDVALPARLSLSGQEAFAAVDSADPGSESTPADPEDPLSRNWTPLEFDSSGTLHNKNTVEDFKAVDKAALLKEAGEKMFSIIANDPRAIMTRPSLLVPFVLLTFADLKKFKFFFWFAFPALVPKEAYTVSRTASVKEEWGLVHLQSLREKFLAMRKASGHGDVGFFLVRRRGGSDPTDIIVAALSEYDSILSSLQPDERLHLGFVDPSGLPHNPGWPLRNFLFFAANVWGLRSASVVCFRDLYDRPDMPGSVVCEVQMSEEPAGKVCPDVVGWERNAAGQLAPRLADLGQVMDPRRLMDSAVDLNLRLMRWRAVPSLRLREISEARCLLLGAGTLGCYVARTLMGWGVRDITFVDYGRVSYSNPVRQPLFEFDDAKGGGKEKAKAAADALKRIYPGMNAEGHNLSIPMPGHPPSDTAKTGEEVAKLEALVDACDVIFLLTDSRESRWLGTVLGRAKGKIVINAALGFDSYLVMRHGGQAADSNPTVGGGSHPPGLVPGSELGCYFCNDVVAPADSLSDRTLDQQCTVTRPGVAALAGALAAELLVSVVNHPDGIFAPAFASSDPAAAVPASATTALGVVPHQIRGFLGQFSTMSIVGRRFTECTACSDKVIEEYLRNGYGFFLKAFQDPKYIEELTGLAELHKATEAADAGDWDVDDDEDPDFEDLGSAGEAADEE